MSSQKFKSDSYCVGGRHELGTKNIVGEITLNEKNGEEVKLLVGKCVICNKRMSMMFSDNMIPAKSLGDFFINLCKKGLNVSKQMAKKRMK